eukprot:526550_1
MGAQHSDKNDYEDKKEQKHYEEDKSDDKDKKNQKHYEEEDKSDDEDDFIEVCVTGGDKRLQIYNTGCKKDAIIHCIGNIRVTYHHTIKGGYSLGTGTIFHVEDNKCLVLTCGHNIRTKAYHCIDNQCCGKMLQKSKCYKCGLKMIKKT